MVNETAKEMAWRKFDELAAPLAYLSAMFAGICKTNDVKSLSVREIGMQVRGVTVSGDLSALELSKVQRDVLFLQMVGCFGDSSEELVRMVQDGELDPRNQFIAESMLR